MALDSIFRHTGSAAITISVAMLCAAVVPIAAGAQATASGTTQPAQAQHSQTTAHSAKRPVHRHVAKAKALTPVAEAPPPPPPPPDWPVNDKAQEASVDWNGRNLHIAATNSSLQQILRDVSTATGVKVEGEAADERIYGSYGPASAREVLAKLLDGTGYNVLMVGDKGEGTPRELVLTVKTNAAPKTSAAENPARQNADDEAQEDPEPPEQTNPVPHRPFGVSPASQPGQGRSPEQIMNEIQQRQQQIQQQQQQIQQQGQPQQQPGQPGQQQPGQAQPQPGQPQQNPQAQPPND
jgi:hypothetical protein